MVLPVSLIGLFELISHYPGFNVHVEKNSNFWLPHKILTSPQLADFALAPLILHPLEYLSISGFAIYTAWIFFIWEQRKYLLFSSRKV